MTTERDIADIRAVLYQMLGSYSAGDIDSALEAFVTDSPSVIGTGRDELAFGTEGVSALMARDVSEPDELYARFESLRINVLRDSAFAFSEVKITAVFGDESHRISVRMTFGLVRTDLGWRIAQIHTSMPHADQPEGRSFAVQLTKTLSDLLESIDSDSDDVSLKTVGLGTTTFLFTDIVDSTSLSRSMGDHEWSALISEHFSTAKNVVENMGGSVVKTLGDGGMFAFPSGTSALLSAREIQRAMAGLKSDALVLRIGVHTGDVLQDRNDYIGLTVSKAARVAAAAQGGQILVSATTADLVNSSGIVFGEPVTVELKGLEGTHTLFPLEWSTAS
ncbi:MAG: nuclear transport factor 2 family protein [Acidimicrobiia bacterium]|nr:nuclear transport factor 2 family protein [Acidimicrobiia bacterium]